MSEKVKPGPNWQRRLLPRPEAAHYLGISLSNFDKLRADGRLVPTEIGGRINFDKVHLDQYIERIQRGGAA